MAKNGQKTRFSRNSEKHQKWPKSAKMTKKALFCTFSEKHAFSDARKTGLNGDLPQNSEKRPKTAKNGQKWPKITKNGEMAKNTVFRAFYLQNDQKRAISPKRLKKHKKRPKSALFSRYFYLQKNTLFPESMQRYEKTAKKRQKTPLFGGYMPNHWELRGCAKRAKKGQKWPIFGVFYRKCSKWPKMPVFPYKPA